MCVSLEQGLVRLKETARRSSSLNRFLTQHYTNNTAEEDDTDAPPLALLQLVHSIRSSHQDSRMSRAKDVFSSFDLYGRSDENCDPRPIPWMDAELAFKELGWKEEEVGLGGEEWIWQWRAEHVKPRRGSRAWAADDETAQGEGPT